MGPHSNLKKLVSRFSFFSLLLPMYIYKKKSCKSYFIFCIVMLCTIFGQSLFKDFLNGLTQPYVHCMYFYLWNKFSHFYSLTCMLGVIFSIFLLDELKFNNSLNYFDRLVFKLYKLEWSFYETLVSILKYLFSAFFPAHDNWQRTISLVWVLNTHHNIVA